MNMPMERPYATFCVGNSNVCHIGHRLRDNHVWTFQCTRFKSLTFKMVKDVYDLDENWQTDGRCDHPCAQKLALLGPTVSSRYNHDLGENWPANIPCQHAYARMFWTVVIKANQGRLNVLSGLERLWRTFRDRRTDGRTDVLPARIHPSTLLERCKTNK